MNLDCRSIWKNSVKYYTTFLSFSKKAVGRCRLEESHYSSIQSFFVFEALWEIDKPFIKMYTLSEEKYMQDSLYKYGLFCFSNELM